MSKVTAYMIKSAQNSKQHINVFFF